MVPSTTCLEDPKCCYRRAYYRLFVIYHHHAGGRFFFSCQEWCCDGEFTSKYIKKTLRQVRATRAIMAWRFLQTVALGLEGVERSNWGSRVHHASGTSPCFCTLKSQFKTTLPAFWKLTPLFRCLVLIIIVVVVSLEFFSINLINFKHLRLKVISHKPSPYFYYVL